MSFTRSIAYIIATLLIAIAICFTCWILALGLSRAHISVVNQSGTTLANLVISGSCKERARYTLAPLAEWQTVTPYHGTIRLSFVSNGKNYASGPILNTNDSGFRAISFTVVSNMIVNVEIRG